MEKKCDQEYDARVPVLALGPGMPPASIKTGDGWCRKTTGSLVYAEQASTTSHDFQPALLPSAEPAWFRCLPADTTGTHAPRITWNPASSSSSASTS